MQKLLDLQKKSEELHRLYKETGKEAIMEALNEVFDRNPEVEQIQWEQYAPSFNDGEPCYFSVYPVFFLGTDEDVGRMNEDDEADEDHPSLDWDDRIYFKTGKKNDWGGDEYDTRPNPVPEPQWHKDLCTINSAFQANEDLLEIVFGEGTRVSVTRNGVTTDEAGDY